MPDRGIGENDEQNQDQPPIPIATEPGRRGKGRYKKRKFRVGPWVTFVEAPLAATFLFLVRFAILIQPAKKVTKEARNFGFDSDGQSARRRA